MAKPDLNKLKSEIEKERSKKNMKQSSFGESVGADVAPRDAFLNGLVESLQTGRHTAASNLVKTVGNKAAIKKGEKPTHDVIPVAPAPVRTPTVEMSPERDEEMWRKFEAGKKQTLAESIEHVAGIQNTGQPHQYVEFGGQRYLAVPPAQQPATDRQQITEGYLVEDVKKIVNGYLSESLSPIFEEAIKSTIIEMYAVERIKEVLHENREMIKSVVIETIREIQAKNKAKAQ